MHHTIRHSYAEGTIIDVPEKGSTVGRVLSRAGWRYSKHLSRWYLPETAGRPAKERAIQFTVSALERIGAHVSVVIDSPEQPSSRE